MMQVQSDLLRIPVDRPAMVETTAFGAAALAGLAVGFFGSPAETVVASEGGTTYTPAMSEENRTRLLEGWHRAVSACRAF